MIAARRRRIGAIAIAAAAVGLLAAGAVQLARGAVVYRWPTFERVVVLTFDDGPDPVYTPRTLRILRREHVPAMFFVPGDRADRVPAIGYHHYDYRHVIASHSSSRRVLALLSPRRQAGALLTGEDEVARVGGDDDGRGGFYVRAPHGMVSPSTLPYLWADRGVYVGWSACYDKREFYDVTPRAERVERFADSIRPGDIVLFHDGNRHAAQMVEDLPLIIRALRARGFRFATLDELRGE